MKKLTFGALLVLAASAFFGSAAVAQDYTFNPGDLMLDFRLSSNTASKNLMVDLGTFNFATSQAVVSGFSAADLTAAYGSNWATNGSNLVFNLSSTDGSSYMDVSDPGNAFHLTGTNTQANGANTGQINNLYNENDGNGTSTGTGDNALSVTPSSGDSSSYVDTLLNVNKDYAPNQFASDFGFAAYNMEQSYSSTGSSITLYKQTSTSTSTALGTFTLSGAGALSYTVATAPEPSTYVMMGLGALALLVLRRRLTQV